MKGNPEDEHIEKEELIELLERVEKASNKLQSFLCCFFPKDQFKLFKAIKRDNMPIRQAAITFHMSRWNIRKNIKTFSLKMECINKLLDL